jgi:hypothetical protein
VKKNKEKGILKVYAESVPGLDTGLGSNLILLEPKM